MTGFTHFTELKQRPKQDSLRIAPDSTGADIEAEISVAKMIDSDTGQHIVYIPALNITGYGETLEKATTMAKGSLADFFEWIMELSNKSRLIELQKLGWKQSIFANKKFSKAFVDMDGVLQNFNVKEATITSVSLATA